MLAFFGMASFFAALGFVLVAFRVAFGFIVRLAFGMALFVIVAVAFLVLVAGSALGFVGIAVAMAFGLGAVAGAERKHHQYDIEFDLHFGFSKVSVQGVARGALVRRSISARRPCALAAASIRAACTARNSRWASTSSR